MQMLTGSDALACIQSAPFRAKWLTLFDACAWATAFQHPDFVVPWFKLYQAHYDPVILFDDTGGARLAGLIVLALQADGTKLVGAGAHQAEYQGWLGAPDDPRFIGRVVARLRTAFPRADLHLRYLPPGTPVHGLAGRPGWTVRSHARPVMQADAAAMARQRSRKNHRQNYNRLSRLGPVRCERVVAVDDFLALVDQVCTHYDFRQAAHFWQTPFRSDPAKQPFFVELFKRGLLHVTAMTVNGNMAACHIGLLTPRRAVHLALTTYDPLLAAHSPGNLLLAMLGMQLAQEAMPVLDLTPGGDPYKVHFATRHDVVGELTVYGNAWRRLQGEWRMRLLRWLKAGLARAGCRAVAAAALVERVKGARLRDWRAAVRVLQARPCRMQYVQRAHTPVPRAIPVVKNQLADVLQFDADGSSSRYCAFLRGAMHRFEKLQTLYSYTEHGRLALACWVRPSPAGAATTLCDFYAHHRVDDVDMVRSFVRQVVNDVQAGSGGAPVGFAGALNARMRAAFAACGFVDESASSRWSAWPGRRTT